jgi:hypothetical protein
MRKQYDFSGGRRSAVIAATRGKTRITIRIDDLLDWFRQQVDDADKSCFLSAQSIPM